MVSTRRKSAFTLVELLVVIGIIGLLISILLPSLNAAREAAKSIKCSSNLRQIGMAVQLYLNESKGYFAPYRNDGRWFKSASTDLVNIIDPYNPTDGDNAYWGVFYSLNGRLKKEVFNCPSARMTYYSTAVRNDGRFENGFVWTTYGINGWGGINSGWTSARCIAEFGNSDECALYRRMPTGTAWLGKNVNRLRNSSQVMLAMDSYEQCLDGNGDTWDNYYEFPDRWREFLRHRDKYANVLFADTHVAPLRKDELTDTRYYNGKW